MSNPSASPRSDSDEQNDDLNPGLAEEDREEFDLPFWRPRTIAALSLTAVVTGLSERDVLGRHLDTWLGHSGYAWITIVAVALGAVAWSACATFWRVPSMAAVALLLLAVTGYELLELVSYVSDRDRFENLTRAGWWVIPTAFILWFRTACLVIHETHLRGVSDDAGPEWARRLMRRWLGLPGPRRFQSLTYLELGLWVPLIGVAIASLLPDTIYNIGKQSDSPWRSFHVTAAPGFYAAAIAGVLVYLLSGLLVLASYLSKPDGLLPSVRRRSQLSVGAAVGAGWLIVMLFLSVRGWWPEPILDLLLSIYLAAFALGMIDVAALGERKKVYSSWTRRATAGLTWGVLVVVPLAGLTADAPAARVSVVFLAAPLLALMPALLNNLHGFDVRPQRAGFEKPGRDRIRAAGGGEGAGAEGWPGYLRTWGPSLIQLGSDRITVDADDQQVMLALELLLQLELPDLKKLISVGAGNRRRAVESSPKLIEFVRSFPPLQAPMEPSAPTWEVLNKRLMELMWRHARLRREDHEATYFTEPPGWTCLAGYLLVRCVWNRFEGLSDEQRETEIHEGYAYKLWDLSTTPNRDRDWMKVRERTTDVLKQQLRQLDQQKSLFGGKTGEPDLQRSDRAREFNKVLPELLRDWERNLISALPDRRRRATKTRSGRSRSGR